MKFIILASLCCLVLVIHASTVPLSEEEIRNPVLIRRKREPLLLTALGAVGLIGAGIVGAGLAGLAGAGLVGAGLGAKAGFAAGAITASAPRTYSGGYYYNTYSYPVPASYEYRANVKVQTTP